MNINKNVLIKYFERNKWHDESLMQSFINDFNNAYIYLDINYNNIINQPNLNNFNKIDKIEYYLILLNTLNIEKNLIFIPLFKNKNIVIGIGYLFTNKGLLNLDKFEMKTFCKFIISNQVLNQLKSF